MLLHDTQPTLSDLSESLDTDILLLLRFLKFAVGN